jgi:hypothetical protein
MTMTQTERLYNLLKDGNPHRTDEILRVVYGSEHNGIARIGARVADLKEGRWPGQVRCNIEGYKDPHNQALYFYKLIPPVVPELPPARDVVTPPPQGIVKRTPSLFAKWLSSRIVNAPSQ